MCKNGIHGALHGLYHHKLQPIIDRPSVSGSGGLAPASHILCEQYTSELFDFIETRTCHCLKHTVLQTYKPILHTLTAALQRSTGRNASTGSATKTSRTFPYRCLKALRQMQRLQRRCDGFTFLHDRQYYCGLHCFAFVPWSSALYIHVCL